MSRTSECLIAEAIRTIDDVIVYRADHPIHGIVNVYLPDDALPPELAKSVKRQLYQNGLRMRSLSLLNLPLVTRALEVSQNPNEPYIVTKCLKHDLEELISNGVTIKPRRMFVILSQALQAIINLAANGWEIDHIHPRQIKLVELHTGDISFTVIEGAGQKTDTYKTKDPRHKTKDTSLESEVWGLESGRKEDRAFAPTAKITQKPALSEAEWDETLTPLEAPKTKPLTGRTPKATTPAHTAHDDIGRTATLDESAQLKYAQKRLRTTQRNIYFLGNITYQLLFGRKYESRPSEGLDEPSPVRNSIKGKDRAEKGKISNGASDKVAAANIRKLGRRWRKILDKALSRNLDYRYDTYEAMLRDVRKASSKNKRVAIASIPFLLLLVVIGSYFAYERYRKYKIMTSEAGQAIKSFLDIVNRTDDEFPELKKPQEASPRPDDQTILEPFEKIEPVDED